MTSVPPATLEPIVHEYRLACPADEAFDTYVRRIGEWWPANYSASPETFTGVTIEPSLGGRIYATFRDRGEDDWGTVTVWEPPHRLEHAFSLAQSATAPSRISVRFLPSAAGCVMRFEHGGWTEANAGYRGKFSDWRLILDRIAALIA